MDEFMKKLKAYIYANPPDFGDGDAESILEMIHWYYAECNPFIPRKSKMASRILTTIWRDYPLRITMRYSPWSAEYALNISDLLLSQVFM